MRTRGGGYTILEVLIFLAVSTFLMVSAIALMSGSRRNTEFAQSIRDFESQISDIINDVPTGYFPTDGAVACNLVSNRTNISNAAGNPLGTNEDCLYIGKALQFMPDPSGGAKIFVYNLAGQRLSPTTNQPVKDIDDAVPAAVALPGLVQEIDLRYGLRVTDVFDAATPTNKYGILGILTRFEGSTPANEVSEGQSVQIGAFRNITSTLNVSQTDAVDVINRVENANFISSVDGFVICLQGDNNKKASLTIGAAGSGSVKLEVDDHHADCP